MFLYALASYAIAQTIIFYQQNITKIFPGVTGFYFHLTLILVSIPVTYLYYYSWNVFSSITGSVWSARFIFFGLSYLVFPFLAFYILGESAFNAKNIISVILSLVIVFIQFKL